MISKRMKQTDIKRIAKLSPILKPITAPITENQYYELFQMAEECVSYRYDYLFSIGERNMFEGNFYSCIIERCKEYFVLRFVRFACSMGDERLHEYYTLCQDKDFNFDEEFDFEEEDNLDISDTHEYKQIWIDKHGNSYTIILDKQENGTTADTFITLDYKGVICPSIAKKMIDILPDEYSNYCYTGRNEELCLPMLKQAYIHLLDKWQKDFTDAVIAHGFVTECYKHSKSIRVAVKHRYTLPTDYETMKCYFAYLDSLVECGLCVTEPRFVCPQDIQKAYAKINLDIKRLQQEKEKREAAQKEKKFAKHHSYLFGIHFDNGHFRFDSLDSVEAYRKEGEIMHHCVFQSKYYNKHDVLTMHVSDMEGNRVATCSVDVVKGEIIELQTMCNNSIWREGDEYKEIWNTLMARMHTFPKPKKERSRNALLKAV